jgi:hypothetical protein
VAVAVKLIKRAAAPGEPTRVWGFATVAADASGEVVIDHHRHAIQPDELERAVARFAKDLEAGGIDVEHDGRIVGRIVESAVVTHERLEALGIDPAGAPASAWLVGMEVVDDDAAARVKSGELAELSIWGDAVPAEPSPELKARGATHELRDLRLLRVGLVAEGAGKGVQIALVKRRSTEMKVRKNAAPAPAVEPEKAEAEKAAVPPEVAAVLEAMDPEARAVIEAFMATLMAAPVAASAEPAPAAPAPSTVTVAMKSAEPAEVAKARAEVAKLRAEVDAMKEADVARVYAAEAERLGPVPHLPREAVVKALRALDEADPALGVEVRKTFSVLGASAKRGDLFKTIGSPGASDLTGATPLEVAAARLRAKDPAMTVAKSLRAALDADPSLYGREA